MHYYSIESSTDYLSHYGVEGMKWGVRKSRILGKERMLDRHYRKAAKKLKKLQDISLHSGKYAAKSAAYGAAAAGVGTLAVGGTNMAGNIVLGLAKKYSAMGPHTKARYENYTKMRQVSGDIKNWGNKAYANKKVINDVMNDAGERVLVEGSRPGAFTYKQETKYVPTVTGNTLYRAGTGLVAAGLVAKSAQNAYRAANSVKYRNKAIKWKNAMDEAFKGTKYEGSYIVPKRKYGIRRKRK